MRDGDKLREAASTLSNKASSAAETLGETATRASEKVSRAATAATEEIAVQVAGEARSIAEETIASRKARAERYLGSVGSAVHAGSHSLERDGLYATADYTRQAAHMIDRLAGQLDDVDIRSATGRVEDFMRTRPVVSFGAALLLGFTAYQLFKSPPSARADTKAAAE